MNNMLNHSTNIHIQGQASPWQPAGATKSPGRGQLGDKKNHRGASLGRLGPLTHQHDIYVENGGGEQLVLERPAVALAAYRRPPASPSGFPGRPFTTTLTYIGTVFVGCVRCIATGRPLLRFRSCLKPHKVWFYYSKTTFCEMNQVFAKYCS